MDSKLKVKIVNIVSAALMEEDISESSTTDNTASWDSLGHLSILSALDEATKGKISEIEAFSNVKSVNEIISLLQTHNIDL